MMKVSGFTLVKNAIKFGYPVVESIESILPICDEVIVSIGDSEDETLLLIKSINSPKIKIHTSVWDTSVNQGGKILAIETDKALAQVDNQTDWCIYIQADEVLHEEDYDIIQSSMLKYGNDQQVEGLLFNYIHFYGSYHTVGISTNFYPNEIRAFKYNPKVYSYRDAQGFRIRDNEKLKVKSIDATVYHYGWAREPKVMRTKYLDFNKLWYSQNKIDESIKEKENFNYAYKNFCVVPYTGTHPQVMQDRAKAMNWNFDERIYRNRLSIKDKIKRIFKKYLGLDFSYRNYKIV